ncbi:hypothetical protein SAMN04488061_2215 [Filomicrobium insigne]|uniref:Uncharacterized protein n=1 Tax=Filomicrobium insigne TaxID=418854 RepID=A0A1H0Q146_9HYPH|nr:hypothetical protein SAMN04488061_2215 [Filomicrobium insigne]
MNIGYRPKPLHPLAELRQRILRLKVAHKSDNASEPTVAPLRREKRLPVARHYRDGRRYA